MKKNNQKTKFEKFGKKVVLNKELLTNTKGEVLDLDGFIH